ncbi:[acyl-carrier-protein] S-malonyltransferase [Caldalkalibacillus uzonensis]|uniref:Malonyl CoA-acyl carrier protein transacylase n=1 Tax=Caldalkalibacillus uzonensis TaxID=353224 RepID=A0ABU0CM85_9BACI|nr:ACP S-malonyltransferase [Caldalkalibacillus uzonensis]MDQ0337540.1 [acyl-carrier-protein] S-malonyltransferase [Caldalkalibacillus uzonensis]
MGKIAFVFPGQGAQYVGMGKTLAEQYEAARNIFALADESLGYSLSTLCFEGPEEELRLTYHTQPAILTTSIALYEVLKTEAPRPDYVAGHSLGEYSALVAAEALSFADAVTTVHKRGKFMDEAVPAGQGAMAAVIGGDRDEVQRICEEISLEGDAVQLANLNSPGQVVISGTKEGVEKASQLIKEQKKARRVIPLEVSGPFHSDLMKPAASRLAHALEKVTIHNAKVPVVTNVEARPVMLAEEIEHALIEQVFSPVLWEDSVRWMIEAGVDTFVEIGPGQVLAGLIKKTSRDVSVCSVYDEVSLKQTLEVIK